MLLPQRGWQGVADTCQRCHLRLWWAGASNFPWKAEAPTCPTPVPIVVVVVVVVVIIIIIIIIIIIPSRRGMTQILAI